MSQRDESGLSLRRVLRTFRSQGWIVVLIALIGAGIAVGAAELRNRNITPNFEAVAPVAVLRLSHESDDSFNRRVETIVAQARSSVSDRLGPGLRVEVGKDDGSVDFVATASQPETARTAATDLRQAYLDSSPSATTQDQLDPILEALAAEIASVQDQLAELQASAQPDPLVEAKRSALQSQLQTAVQQQASLEAKRLDPNLSPEERADVEESLTSATNLINVVEEELASLPDPPEVEAKTQLDTLALKKKLNDLQNQYVDYATQGDELGDQGLVGEPYVVDQTTAQTSLLLAALVGLAAGALVGAGGVLVTDRVNEPIRGPDELRGLTVVEVPPRSSFRNSADWYRLAKQDLRKPQVQALRAQLEQTRGGSVVMLAGLDVLPAEVETLATDLAVSVAASGLKVMIIDTQLELGEPADEPGSDGTLADILRAQSGRDADPSLVKRKLSERREAIPNLLMVPAGTLLDDTADALAGPGFRTVMSEARELVDLVVVSAPSVGEVGTDTVAANSRYGMIVGRKSRTRRAAVQDGTSRLEDLGVSVLAVALLTGRRRRR